MFGSEARVVQRGYVSEPAVSATLQRVRAGLQVDLFPIVRLLGLEVWLRHLDATYPQKTEGTAVEPASSEVASTPELTAKGAQRVSLTP
jgi:hypothetical protein